jgi:hypothetical protein
MAPQPSQTRAKTPMSISSIAGSGAPQKGQGFTLAVVLFVLILLSALSGRIGLFLM